MNYTDNKEHAANNSSRDLFQRLLQETEGEILEEVDDLFQFGGITVPAKLFYELLSTMTEQLGQDPDNVEFELSQIKDCVLYSSFIMAKLCAMYDMYNRRDYYRVKLRLTKK